MANYKDIKGFQIQSTSSDPVPYSGTWASVANINTARSAFQNRGGGSNTQGFVVGGLEPAISSKTESWNGSAWSEVGDTPAGARSGMATGAYTSAIQGGGDPGAGKTGECDTWNGTSWTEVAELNSAREIGGAGGASSTSALFFGGDGPNPSRAITEKWDGSSWTEVGDLNTGRNIGVGLGTQTAALAIAGYVPPSASGKKDLVEQWNGTSWTEVNDLNTARMDMGGSGLGVTAAIAYGGQYPPSTKIADTEQFDGTSWTEVNNLGTARGSVGSIGTSSTGVVSAGGVTSTTSWSNISEEWSFPSPTASLLNEGDMWFNTDSQTLKVFARDVAEGTWASGTNMNNANAAVGSFGISTAAIEFGGYYSGPGSAPGRITTEEYDGTSWTEKSDMSNYRAERPGAGTTAAGLAIRGNPGNATAVEAWGGSSWTAANGTNTPNGGNSACGTQTAAITFGGETTANTELYDGTSWTEVNNMNTARGKMSGSGVQMSAVGSGGAPGPQVLAETWDGSTWAEVTELNTPRSAGAAGGASDTSSLAFGGGPSRTANTEYWNGSSWTEVANLSSATQDMNYGNVGTTGGTLAIGGDASPPVSTRTEAWTATDATISTVTTS